MKHKHPEQDKIKMKRAYELANTLLRDRLKNEEEENIEILDDVIRTDIIVIDGTYDHIHLVLDSMKLPYTRMSQVQMEKFIFRPEQTVFVNCASSFPAEGARNLAGFVSNGGQLITTDWALKFVLEVGFPGYVRYNQNPTADEVVRIELLEKDDPVLSGFLDEEADPVWWLEGSSYPIEVLDKSKVRVLVRSKEVGEKYGADPVIISFTHGKGIVYHMISHFYLQRSETREAKHNMKASEYATMKGGKASTIAAWQAAEEAEPDMDYGTVQSASTSAEFISRLIIKQKKKSKN
ncbi:MAG: hypothetical protein JXB49_19780 [Bacteroidales bacterium]|nr:hypothetical protein [Bacteroidales bacterium]